MTDNPKFEIIDGDYPEAGRIEGDGWTVSIRYDDCPDNPRDWTDCWIGTMMTSHSRYNFGNDDHDIQLNDAPDATVVCDRCDGSGYDPDEWEILVTQAHWAEELNDDKIRFASEDAAWKWAEAYIDPDIVATQIEVQNASCSKCESEGEIDVGLIEYIKREYGATVILPIYLYDHSGLSMSAGTFGKNPGYPYNDQWDAGMVGVIFDTPEQIEKTGINPDPENIEKALRSEIDEYDKYLRGEVFYVRSRIPGLEAQEESVGGYVGEEWAEEEARSMAETCDKIVQEERAERKRWAERDVITTKG